MDQSPDLSRLRTEYRQYSLSEQEVDPDPIRQFMVWFSQALNAQVREPNAMTLATATPEGVPSARIVLLKGVDADGFVFFTNYLSQKGRELERNPRATLLFFWPELERQVRVEGTVSRASAEESDAYFATRPAASRIGAAASPQSQVIPSREFLEERFKQLETQYPQGDVPRPAYWGGFRLHPQRLEFWQGRPGRLHDRIDYVRDSRGQWIIRRIAP
jgi:pyridoxamine 5'-phosphate oxidase